MQSDLLQELLLTPFSEQQANLRKRYGAKLDHEALKALYLENPFMRLTDMEAETLGAPSGLEPLAGLVTARHHAMRVGSHRHVVFCMPKSGSTFIKAAVAHALDLPIVSLTSFGNTRISSLFGMNGREQEIDEVALIKAVLVAPRGFVAQHHTRYTQYLALQMSAFGLRPIVTIRNVLDALVSFDDMMMARGRRRAESWVGDTAFALPADYPEICADDRYRLLGASLGVWLIQFHLSWLRAERQGLVSPVKLRYEDHVLDTDRLIALLEQSLELDARQTRRLDDYARNPDRERVRLNVGRAGRGAGKVPSDVRENLLYYGRAFKADIPEADIEYLLGSNL